MFYEKCLIATSKNEIEGGLTGDCTQSPKSYWELVPSDPSGGYAHGSDASAGSPPSSIATSSPCRDAWHCEYIRSPLTDGMRWCHDPPAVEGRRARHHVVWSISHPEMSVYTSVRWPGAIVLRKHKEANGAIQSFGW